MARLALGFFVLFGAVLRVSACFGPLVFVVIFGGTSPRSSAASLSR